MRIIFSSSRVDGISIINLMKKLATLGELGSRILDSIVYDNKFTECLLNTLHRLHPTLDLIGNSFIQQSVLEKLSDEISIHVFTEDTNVNKYLTGNVYKSLYTQLKKSGVKNLHLNKQVSINQDVTCEEVLKDVIIIWKEIHMGEITDAISRAIKEVMSEGTDNTTDRVKQAMANMGMEVEGYSKQESTHDYTQESDVQSVPDNFMNKPCSEESEEQAEDDSDEICYKVSNGRLLIMIPKGTKLNEVTVDGVTFNTVATKVPDITSKGLQIFPVLDTDSSAEVKKPAKKVTKPNTIIRVPIFLKDLEADLEQENVHQSDSVEGDSDDLKARKKKLDEQIKQARANGDDSLVAELRKQRRKVRNELNKLVGV